MTTYFESKNTVICQHRILLKKLAEYIYIYIYIYIVILKDQAQSD